MPELPEVETVRRGLERLVVGRTVAELTVLEPKCFRLAEGTSVKQHLLGATVVSVSRRGKVLQLGLTGSHSLVGHLKMTGQLVVVGPVADDESLTRWGGGHPTDSLIDHLPDRSTRVVFQFDNGSRLFFNDQRKFGWLLLMPTSQVGQIELLAKMGPEPLEGEPWPEFLSRVRRHQATSIKAALLNQTVVAGIGNIYADEACWAARVHPATKVGRLNDRQLRALLGGATEAMRAALAVGGSTDRTYVNAEGKRGAYLDFAKVFRKDGQPCPRCGATIIKLKVAGRGTHLCPRCQRLAA